jgi:hypothetical protein
MVHVLVNKYADHFQPYCQSQIFERGGINIDRSTLADWVRKSPALLEPLADAIGLHVLVGQAIVADGTPVQMLAPGTDKAATARLWADGRDERPWGSSIPTASWYQFSPDHKGQYPPRIISQNIKSGCMQIAMPGSKISLAGAIRYVLTRMVRHRPHLDHGALELDRKHRRRGDAVRHDQAQKRFFAGSQNNGMSEAFVNTLKRDYVNAAPLSDAATVLGLIAGWFAGRNENHPHFGLKMRSSREVIADQTATA